MGTPTAVLPDGDGLGTKREMNDDENEIANK
jgi:hypothetical protein